MMDERRTVHTYATSYILCATASVTDRVEAGDDPNAYVRLSEQSVLSCKGPSGPSAKTSG